jgi:A/G-specific adenine glycosylase
LPVSLFRSKCVPFPDVLSPAADLLARRAAFRIALLDWYRANRRRLPWREAPSLYKTVVSEFMLQQTQVKTMLPYFARWLETFPDFTSLAAAEEEQVVKLWEGLGYYTRARNLHRLARALVAQPAPPKTPEAWRELPGIGPYTAAAITSITFSAPVAVVDGNVVRILSRLAADATAFRDSTAAAKVLGPLADSLLNRDDPGDHNQAMMELGATVCHRQSPLCTICPVLEFCAARRVGDPEGYPRLAAKIIEARTVVRAWCRRESDGALLLHRTAAASRRLAGQHELPSAEHLGLGAEALVKAGDLLAVKKRGITRFAFTEPIHLFPESRVPRSLDGGLVWVGTDALETVLMSGPHRRWVRELLAR